MNQAKAKESLLDGDKLTHPTFSPDEYVYMENGRLLDEGGHYFDQKEFWSLRQHSSFNKDWTVYEPYEL